MGKVNNNAAVEIIPLDDSTTLNQQALGPTDPALFENRARMHRMPYISDSTIVPRVRKYLESNLDKTYIDINIMADDLQKKYKEYAKRKRSAFRGSVKKAYSSVLQSYGVDNHHQSTSDEMSEDSVIDEEVRFEDNPLNSQLMEMYGRPLTKPPLEENELIDISSDDSGDQESPPSNDKVINGASTSQKSIIDKPPIPPLISALPNLQTIVKSIDSKKVDLKVPLSTFVDRGKKRKFDNQDDTNLLDRASKKKKSVATLQEPSVTFKDIGGMDKLLEDVCKLLLHVRHPEVYRQIGITPPRGFLLHGPPGCGKTLLANAIAGELAVPLLKVAAPELVAGVSGESEERIRELFERATLSAPCVLFIDEIDAITPNRQNVQKEMERRIVAQLLSCLDELSQNANGERVVVIGATNRPDSLDPALRRAGRFDREVCLGIPDVHSRLHILKVLTKKLKLAENFDYDSIAKYSPGFVGADLLALTREAAMAAVNRVFNNFKEKRKLEYVASLQKSQQPAQDIRKEENLVLQETSVTSESKDAEVSTSEDKEKVPASSENDAAGQVSESDSSIVIVDDDVIKQTAEEVTLQPIITDAMLVGPVREPKTTLEELIMWLHEQAPLTNAQLADLFVTMEDFAAALKCVQPSAKREGFATVPDVTWDDVGSLKNIREELQMTIVAPVRYSEQFKALGMNTPTGVLLCGPPGCGKTLLAKAIANEAGINFISVKGPELLNMYVGESERAVRVCFERARNSAPCVIFFDELDALCPKRSDTGEGGASMRVVNQMLTEMDGIEGRQGVYLLAASNRPDIVDTAVLRPGRLDKILYVGLPSDVDRADILRAVTKNGTRPLLAPNVDLEVIGKSEECEGYTGADLAALVREASVEALKEFMHRGNMQQALLVTTEHFKRAVAKIRPSVTEKDQKHYEKLRKLYAADKLAEDVEKMEYS